jgi:IclR family transcriptional regulator, acetate operon repressor
MFQTQRTVMPAAGRSGASAGGRGVLEGAFALLDALRRCGGEAGLNEMAAACGMPKSSAHRLLDQMLLIGAVERRGRRYRLGPQLYRLGESWQPHPGLRLAARYPLHRLRAATGASVLVAVLRDDRALTVASVPGEVEAQVPVRDGMSFTLDTAAGQVLTARQPVRVLEREEVMAGISCAALPIHSPGGRPVAVLTVMVAARERLRRAADEAARAGEAITAALGVTPDDREFPPVLHY